MLADATGMKPSTKYKKNFLKINICIPKLTGEQKYMFVFQVTSEFAICLQTKVVAFEKDYFFLVIFISS